MNMVKTLASFSEISSHLKVAVREKNVIGAQQAKLVKMSRVMCLVTWVSLEFQAWEPQMEQYILV